MKDFDLAYQIVSVGCGWLHRSRSIRRRFSPLLQTPLMSLTKMRFDGHARSRRNYPWQVKK